MGQDGVRILVDKQIQRPNMIAEVQEVRRERAADVASPADQQNSSGLGLGRVGDVGCVGMDHVEHPPFHAVVLLARVPPEGVLGYPMQL